ncbi:hypothetical protein HK103_006967 [Boothiomyces macroporosus]|uniref:UspA domain-containing protein n=1 Tax=Boothiomyces macroporosus TaxID=261099 RepID=A0AAD5UPK7_9FUNG|nr:hypothetical protein HK103_006967 [Boothiomyces macroporosus]
MTFKETVIERLQGFRPNRMICFAIDESPNTLATIQSALGSLIDPKSDLVVLLHCMKDAFEVLKYDNWSGSFEDYQNIIQIVDREYHTKGTNMLNEAAKQFNLANVQVEAILLRGEPKYTLVEEIEQLKPNFVVVSKGKVDGQVSEIPYYFAHTLKIPILIYTF